MQLLTLALRVSSRLFLQSNKSEFGHRYNCLKEFNRNACKKAAILLAPGSEEVETVTSVAVFRSAGLDVTVAGVCGCEVVTCENHTKIKPDLCLEDAIQNGPYDIIVLPGGLSGARVLSGNKLVGRMLRDQERACRYIGAICAGPIALKAHCIGLGRKLTSYPTTCDIMCDGGNYQYQQDKIVVDGFLITSRGPATAMLFAVTMLEKLCGKEKAQDVSNGLLY